MKRYFSLLLLAAFASASVLITNGDFEQQLSVGWSETMSGFGVMLITRDTGYDPDPDNEVFLHKGDGTGYVEIAQTAYIPVTDIEFSVNAKFYVYGTSNQCWAGSAICIAYVSASDSTLGFTKIVAPTIACPWVNSPTCHIIEVADTLWNNYIFNLNDELGSLSGVNASDVAKVRVSAIAQCVDD